MVSWIQLVIVSDPPGGTAGCVVAGRLSDAFPDLKIVIIENGPESKDNPVIDREYSDCLLGRTCSERV